MKKTNYLLFLFLLIFIASCGRTKYPTTRSEQARDIYQTGEELRLQLYFRNALDHFLEALSIDSTFALAAVQASQMYASFGNYDSAEYYIELAKKLAPEMPQLERLLIKYHWLDFNKKGKQRRAVADSLYALNPENFDVRVINAYEYWYKFQFAESRKRFQAILRDYPNYIIAYNNIGYLYAREGLFKEAVNNLEKYKRYAANQLNPYDSLAEIYIAIGRYHEAIRILEYLIESRFDELRENEYIGSTVIIRTAVAYCHLGQYQKALDYLDQAENLFHSPHTIRRIYLHRFQIYRDLDQLDKMEKVLNKLMALIPHDPFIYNNAILNIEKGEYNKVLEILNSYKTKFENSDEANHGYLITQAVIEGDLNLKTGLYSEASAKFELAADTYNDPMNSQNLRTKQFIAMGLDGQYDAALSGLRKLIKMNPNNPLALIYASEYHLKLGKRSEAQAYINHFLNLWENADPGTPYLEKARAIRAALNR